MCRKWSAALCSLLKKGAGSEVTCENPATNDGREAPVPLFQRTAMVAPYFCSANS